MCYSINSLKRKNEISSAVIFVCSELSINDPAGLNYQIRITDNYEEDYKKIHFKPEDAGIDSNGMTIPPIFQSEKFKADNDGKTVILINEQKLKNTTNVFYASVLVHELSHCYDYSYRLNGFQNKYGIEISKVKKGTVEDEIGGFFCDFTEIRAKYLQEKYIINNTKRGCICKNIILSNVNYIIEPLSREGDHYQICHCVGKLRCWEEVPFLCPEEEKIVESIKLYYLEKHIFHEAISEMYKVWDWCAMIKKCDSLIKDK